MDKEILRNIIREGQEDILSVRDELYRRPFNFEDNGRYVMTGVRHAGKSYLLYQRALELIDLGHSLEEMLYINFDDERLYGVITAAELDDILQAYASMYPHKPILLLDEIQNIDGWEHFARRLANRKYRLQEVMQKCSVKTWPPFLETDTWMKVYRHTLSGSIWRQKG